MTAHDELVEYALAFPEAWQDTPWEQDLVAKVGKKIFVFFGDGGPPTVGVKLPESAEQALLSESVTKMAYGLGKWGWVTVHLDHPDAPDTDVIEDWIEESYRAIATKKLIARLDAER